MSAATDMQLHILGSNSALPANGRNPTAQLLQSQQHSYLIDCGEGTQLQLRRFGLKMQRIKVVMISHLHGDHYYGLPGLLNSMHLLGRKAPITIICPEGFKQVFDLQMNFGGGRLAFPIDYRFTDHIKDHEQHELLYEDGQLMINGFLLKHRIPCTGFRIDQKPKLRAYLPKEAAEQGVMVKDIPEVKAGRDVESKDGRVIKAVDVTEPPEKPRSYAYCTDTLPLPTTAHHVKDVDLLYHEATFQTAEIKRAKSTYHSTALQAAKIAAEAGAKRLLLGHFSARYNDLKPLLEEAKTEFEAAELAIEGSTFEI